jgi:hypothetical protein
MNREKQGRQAQKASVHRKGRTNVHHLSGTSDVLLWGLPLIADNSLYFSRRTYYDARNTECCMPECFSVCSSQTSRLTAAVDCSPKRSGNWRSEPNGRVCPKTFWQVFASLSSRQSAVVSFSEARPQSMRWQKRTAPTTKPSAVR